VLTHIAIKPNDLPVLEILLNPEGQVSCGVLRDHLLPDARLIACWYHKCVLGAAATNLRYIHSAAVSSGSFLVASHLAQVVPVGIADDIFRGNGAEFGGHLSNNPSLVVVFAHTANCNLA